MPTLMETLRSRFEAHQDSLRALQGEISEQGGDATEEQDARLRDLQTEVERLAPRLEQQATLERTIAATAQVLARAPSSSLPAGSPAQLDPGTMYRSAGQYLCDYVAARQHDQQAADRIGLYLSRAVQNVTTADTPGVVPDPIVGTVLQWIDSQRPLVDAFGVRPLPAYPTFYRPSITQHTQVGAQSAEKTEIVSRKLTINRLPITAKTYGGYVDLSLQDRDFSNPSVMDILVNDLAAQYAIETEADFATTLASITQNTPLESTATRDQIVAAVYTAAGLVYQGSGRLPNILAVSVDQWGRFGGLFPSVNPQSAFGDGFMASSFGGAQLVGLRMVVSPQLPAGTAIVGTTAAAEVYEQRVGTLQALEVSLLGIQVGYAGYWADVVLEPDGFCKLTDTTP